MYIYNLFLTKQTRNVYNVTCNCGSMPFRQITKKILKEVDFDAYNISS